MTEPPDALLDARSDPVARAVLEDWCLKHGHGQDRLGWALWIAADDDAAAYAAAARHRHALALLKEPR